MFKFTETQLNTIHDMLEITPFVQIPYRWYHGFDESLGINTVDVEDWVIDFYNAYNKMHPNTY